MSLAALPPHMPHPVSSKPPPVFEFTKRKKWADILISELSGSVLFILNPAENLLWASPAICELLGWRDDELLERPIKDLLHDDDAVPFAEHLKYAVNSRTELFAYARLRSKFASPRSGSPNRSPSDPSHSGQSNPPASPSTTTPLFELRGHAIYSKPTPGSSGTESGPSSSSSSMNREPNPNAEPESSCFVIMARPYPSRNTAMLDSFLELKIENERLRQQLLNLRTSGAPASPTLTSPTYPIGQISSASDTPLIQPASSLNSPVYPSANLGALSLGGPGTSGDADAAYQPHTIHAMPQPPAATNMYYPSQNRFSGNSYDGGFPSASFGAGPTAGPSGATTSARRASIAEEMAPEPTEGARSRKKASAAFLTKCVSVHENCKLTIRILLQPKKTHATQEQYVCVTCGRTDSPEWRKGPLGAKTLCNACGLRWAKRNTKRKTDEFGGAVEGGG
ncbi:hypothetical protein BDV93DRAFT_554755 [Ceratobasidium sp. AG-I]|nr:hypothetical protein BDV93DRAFT_554755 [Ceratobasidium sp. AG-I]